MISTERLLLRQFEPADAAFILTLLNTPGWLQYIGDRNVRSLEAAARYISKGPMKSYQEHGFGLLLVVEREQGQPIGMCGLLKRDSLEFPDLGFAFLPEYTGKGYAFEAASAVLRDADETLRLSAIAAITAPENESSVKLLGKLGFVFKERTLPEEGTEELLLFCRQK
jgi:RimJ/RimL family protein N-acetyltransferase